ncbi:hypothetical protein ABTX77_32070 [Streptomyces sp. NPDC097704]|uniref:hypothetical protein n=1 Tax=Streptomyces sp. NPDC097704 TaxID=3157101 RepID=UPI00331B84C2
MPTTLYHFTTARAWDSILKDGYLEPSWDYGGTVPAIVHTTESSEASSLPLGHESGRPIRFELLIPEGEAHHWHAWGKAKGLPPEAYRALGIPVWTPDDREYLTDTNRDSLHWYVVERRIASAEWVQVTDTESGAVLWPLPQD